MFLRIHLLIGLLAASWHSVSGDCPVMRFDDCPPGKTCTKDMWNMGFHADDVGHTVDFISCNVGTLYVLYNGKWQTHPSKHLTKIECVTNTLGGMGMCQLTGGFVAMESIACVVEPCDQCGFLLTTECPPEANGQCNPSLLEYSRENRCGFALCTNASYVPVVKNEDGTWMTNIWSTMRCNNQSQWIDNVAFVEGNEAIPAGAAGVAVQATCAMLNRPTTTTTTTTTAATTTTTFIGKPPLRGNCGQDCPDLPSTNANFIYDYDPVLGCRRVYCGNNLWLDPGNWVRGMYWCEADNTWSYNGTAIPFGGTETGCSAGRDMGCQNLPLSTECPQGYNCTGAGAPATNVPSSLVGTIVLQCNNSQLWINTGGVWETDIGYKCLNGVKTNIYRGALTNKVTSKNSTAICLPFITTNKCNKCLWIDNGSPKLVQESCELDDNYIRLRCPNNAKIYAKNSFSDSLYVPKNYLYCNQVGKWMTDTDGNAKSVWGPYIAEVRCDAI